MARPRTYFELNRLAEIAQRREAAREAARRASTPQPYVPEQPKTIRAVRSIENDDVYVKMPISQTAWTAITGQANGLGLLTLEAAEALAGSSVINFEGNNDEILRVRVNLLKATPTVRMTEWGSRVVDKIDSSFSFPLGVVAANNSISAAKVQFRGFFAGAGSGILGTRVGNFAQLIYRKKIIEVFVKAAAA
jgi:hypothetical protein